MSGPDSGVDTGEESNDSMSVDFHAYGNTNANDSYPNQATGNSNNCPVGPAHSSCLDNHNQMQMPSNDAVNLSSAEVILNLVNSLNNINN